MANENQNLPNNGNSTEISTKEIRRNKDAKRNGYPRKRNKKPGFNKTESGINPGNDFSYHNKFAELMQALLKYPWMHIQGTNINVPNKEGSLMCGNVITAEFLMTPGVCADPTDAFNLTSRDQWLELHRKYRGIGTYQQADYGITRLCIISLMVEILNAQRLYGIMHGYPVINRVNPEGMLRSLGYTTAFIASLKSSLSDFRSRLNRIIVKSRRLCLPKDLAVTKLWGGLASFVYKDSKNDRACYLAFNPAGFWHYNAKAFKTGTAAEFVRYVPSDYGSSFELLDEIEGALDIMLTDDDVSRMCSDTIAAYGLENMESIAEFAENYTVDAVYDESILIKFHNSVSRFGGSTVTTFVSVYDSNLITELYDKNSMYIYQNDNNIIFDPVFIQSGAGLKAYDIQGSTTKHVTGPETDGWHNTVTQVHNAPVLDTWEDVPSDATRCESLLWKNTFSVMSANLAGVPKIIGIRPSFFSAEIIGHVQVHTVIGGEVADYYDIASFYSIDSGAALEGTGYPQLSQFDWAPFVYLLQETRTENPQFKGLFGDLDNYTIVDVSSIAPAIYDCSTLSLFKSDLVSKS